MLSLRNTTIQYLNCGRCHETLVGLHFYAGMEDGLSESVKELNATHQGEGSRKVMEAEGRGKLGYLRPYLKGRKDEDGWGDEWRTKANEGAEETAQQLPLVLAENLGSAPSVHLVLHNHL